MNNKLEVKKHHQKQTAKLKYIKQEEFRNF